MVDTSFMSRKPSFKRAMKYLYPNGVSAAQLRDLVRVYAMGWSDALLSVETTKDGIECSLDYSGLADPNWSPDDTWKWW